MKKGKLVSAGLILSGLIASLMFTNSASAFSVSQLRHTFDIEPGETHEIEVTIGNPDDSTPVALEVREGVIVLEEGDKNYYELEFLTVEEPAYSLRKYITTSKSKTGLLNTGETETITVSIEIPEDATPGSYLGTLFVSPAVEANEGETGGIGVGLSGRIALTFTANVAPDQADEKLAVDSFSLDAKALKTGSLAFLIDFKNEGNVVAVPTGKITIFKEGSNEPLENIIRTIEEVGDEIITKGFLNEITFNAAQGQVFPDEPLTMTAEIPKGNLMNLEPGKYYAKLEAFFGAKGETLEAKSDVFEIKDIVYIDSFEVKKGGILDKNIEFSATVENQGQSAISGTANIYVKNILGMTVDVINLQTSKILAGTSSTLTTEWAAPRGMGLYFASMDFSYNDRMINASTPFMHIDAIQSIIALIVLIILILVIFKGTKAYLKLKKKADKVESKEEKTE